MLYLSRLILNLRDRNARRDLADVQQLHRTILRAFPETPDRDKKAREYFGVLFRAEPLPDQPLAARVLVQSAYQPDWSHLLSGYLAPPLDDRPNPAVRAVDDYDRIVAGMALRFRLRANPTQRIGKNNTDQDEKWRGKRVELRREEDQYSWIARKAEQGGFRLLKVATRADLENVRISPQANVVGYRSHEPLRPKMTFGVALFEGLLEVQDVERFRQTLISGIGSGKAYGFGLLSIATMG
jgi:CRISPR system Cascade subunit CasE